MVESGLPPWALRLRNSLLLHSCRQHKSPHWVFSWNPTFQSPALMCTGRHFSQVEVLRAMAWSICGRSHSVLSATEQLLGPSVSPESSLSVPADLPANEGPCPEGGTTAHPQVPHEGHAFSFFFFSSIPLFLSSYWWYGNLFHPFRCQKSSARVKSVRLLPFVDIFLMHLLGVENSIFSYSPTIL